MQQALTQRHLRTLAARVILGAILGGVLAAVVVLTLVSRTYDARATLVFPLPERTGTLAALALQDSPVPQNSEFPLDTYKAILTSDLALTNLVRQFDLVRVYKAPNEREAVDRLRQNIAVTMNLDRLIIISARTKGTPRMRGLGDLFSSSSADQRDQPKRRLAANLCAALIAQLRQISASLKLDRTKGRLDDLIAQRDTERTELERLRAQYAALQAAMGKPDLPTYVQELTRGYQKLLQQIGDLDGQIALTASQRAAAQAQLRQQIRDVDKLPTDVPFLSAARTRYNEAKAQFNLLSQRFGPQNPDVLKAGQAVRQARGALETELRTAARGMTPELLKLDATLQALKAQRAQMQRLADQLEQQMRGLPAQSLQAVQMQTELEQRTARLKNLETETFQAEMDYQRRGVRWNVLDEPREPLRKSGPKTMLALLGGMFIGALLLGGGSLLRLAGDWLNAAPEPAPTPAHFED